MKPKIKITLIKKKEISSTSTLSGGIVSNGTAHWIPLYRHYAIWWDAAKIKER